MANQGTPLWQRLNSTWQEATERRKSKAKAARREQEALLELNRSSVKQSNQLEEWFGEPIPNLSGLSQAGHDFLLECALMNKEPNKSLSEEEKSTEDHFVEAVWWLKSYRTKQSLYDLSRSTAKWRKARYPETSIQISAAEVSKNQDNRPYMERVLTSHAAALCDVYRKNRDSSLLRRAVELDNRALSVVPENRHTLLQLHRAYSLLGSVDAAIRAVVKAAGSENHQRTSKYSVSNEISATWRIIQTEGWGNTYRDSVLRAIEDGSLPNMKELPF